MVSVRICCSCSCSLLRIHLPVVTSLAQEEAL